MSLPTENHLTTMTGGVVSSDVVLGDAVAGLFSPVLQLADGSFVGSGLGGMVALDASGNVKWAVPGGYTPDIATADGSIIGDVGGVYNNGNQYVPGPGSTFDASTGLATGQLPSFPTQSWVGNEYQLGSVALVNASAFSYLPTFAAIFGGNNSTNGTAIQPGWFPQLVRCSNPADTAQCQANNWTSATGGPRDWIYNALYALRTLLGKTCDQNSQADQQACFIDQYVFTNNLKDAKGTQATRASFLQFLNTRSGNNPYFLDGTQSTWHACQTIDNNCSYLDLRGFRGPTISTWFAMPQNSDVRAATVEYPEWVSPQPLPPLTTFFLPSIIWKELLSDVADDYAQSGRDNMAMVFHEALHGYTRLKDPELKGVLGCSTGMVEGSYDITLFLKQFTRLPPLASSAIQPCSYFSNQTPPVVPPQ
jgi:hypothetical protein